MSIQSYFTKQTDVRSIILDYLDGAEKKVIVAVAWFTDSQLFNKLLEIQLKGVIVEVIITKHQFNTESRNDYSLLKEQGFFAELGSDDELMHMKFCVIDFDIVISGSANWSNKAFAINNEEVTIVTNEPQRANDFIEEFERLKDLTGQVKDYLVQLDIAKAYRYFTLIKAFVDLGETSKINPYLHEIKEIKELGPITRLLLNGEYEAAFIEIENFKKQNSQLVDVTAFEREQLRSQIRLISYQIEVLEVEKTEIDTVIEQFNHRFILELNPLITRIISLKKKLYEKLKRYGIIDDTFEELEEEFNRANQQFEEESKIEIPDLNEEESLCIKQLYRDGVKLCHPDSPLCIYKDKVEATRVFDELTNYYKHNAIEKVQLIVENLKNGNSQFEIDEIKELDILRARLESLKVKYARIKLDIQLVRATDDFIKIQKIKDWDVYFKNQKQLLNDEFERLNSQYVDYE